MKKIRKHFGEKFEGLIEKNQGDSLPKICRKE